MQLFNTFTTIEPCRISKVDTDRMLATVRGYRNIGEMEVCWTDYTHPGFFGEEDAHYGGRTPKEGAIALVLAEWSSLDKTLQRAYIIGYLPAANLQFSKQGYGTFRNDYHGPQTTGGTRFTSSTKSQIDLDDSGNITTESTPQNYQKRSPEDNKVTDVSENFYHLVSGFFNRVTYDEHGNNQTRYERVVSKKNPVTEYNTTEDRDKVLNDSGNVVCYEEIGGNVDPSYMVYNTGASLPAGFGKPYYKMTVINSGSPVYTKMVDENGNVFESAKGNYSTNVKGTVTFNVSTDMFMNVANLLHQAALVIEWIFNSATGSVSGGSGIVEWVVNKINFRKR